MRDDPSPALSLQQTAYNTITTFFTTYIDRVTEIIILPPGIEPEDGISMQEELNLGVPKKVLALAFLEARARFFKGVKEKGVVSDEALEATYIILLFDPEHLTAANYRKKYLVHHRETARSTFPRLLYRELVFTCSILTSPLHRQSKSPTLWYHRFWLLTAFLLPLQSGVALLPSKCAYHHPSQQDEEPDVNPTNEVLMDHGTPTPQQLTDFIEREIAVVLKSGEQHPRNYYAFNYARKLLTHVLDYHNHHRHHQQEPHPQTHSQQAPNSILQPLPSTLKKWCTKTTNASDTSGYSFLLFLLRLYHSHPSQTASPTLIIPQTLSTALQIRLATLAPYRFIREACADEHVGLGAEGRREVWRMVEGAVAGLREERVHEVGERVSFEERVRGLKEGLDGLGLGEESGRRGLE